MPTPSDSPVKGQVAVVITKGEDGRYKTGSVDRIGGTRGKSAAWVFRNQTHDPIRVTIGNFRRKAQQEDPNSAATPTDCPVEGAKWSGGKAAVDLDRPGDHGQTTGTVPAKLIAVGIYSYDILVANRDREEDENKIDPELQIDDTNAFHHLIKSPVVIGVALVVLVVLVVLVALAARWLFG